MRARATALMAATNDPPTRTPRAFALAFAVVLALVLARVALRGAEAHGPDDAPAAAAAPALLSTALAVEPAASAADERPLPARAPAGPPPWNAAVAARLAPWIERAAHESPLVRGPGDVSVGVCVVEPARGQTLCALDADRPLPPASNMKLVTTAAALVLLGPAMEFVTPFEAGGPVEEGTLHGDLVVRAGGDPLVPRGPDERVEAPLSALARRLFATGVRRVTGALVLDEGDFAAPEPAPGWPDETQRWAAYCALAGGFSVNGGVLEARVDPGPAGGKARVEVRPAAHGLERRYDVDTIDKGPLNVLVGATQSAVTVRGRLPRSAGPYAAEFSYHDPVELFGAVLRAELERAGIAIDGPTVRRRGAPGGATLATLRSPLEGALGPINAESRNGVADQLFLTLGHALEGEGSRAAGERVTRRALERLGVSVAGFAQADGSGLSRDNRVSARQIAALLEAVLSAGEQPAALYRESLAVAGERGTLEDRMQAGPARGRVRAKTGWIAGVSALSGVLETLDGRELVFAILVSYPKQAGGLNTSVFKPMQDELVSALVEGAP